MPQLYDYKSKQWVETPHEEYTERVRSGAFGVPKNYGVPAIGPDGQFQEIDPGQAKNMFNSGWRFPKKEEISDYLQRQEFTKAKAEEDARNEKEYDSPIQAGVLGVARGASVGLSDPLLTATGLYESEELRNLEKYNPDASMAGELTGAIAPAFIPGGQFTAAGALSRLGVGTTNLITKQLVKKAATKGLTESAKLSLVQKATAAGIGSAVEGAFYGAGEVISEDALGNATLNAQTLTAGVGLGSILGGVTGGAFTVAGAGLSKLFKTSPEIKAAQETIKKAEAISKNTEELVQSGDNVAAQQAAGVVEDIVPPIEKAQPQAGPKQTWEEFFDSQPIKREEISGTSHRPTESGATLNDITMDGEYIPKDMYTNPEYYADMKDKAAKESFAAIKKYKGKSPDTEVTIYRGGPKRELRTGDWVSLSKEYAKREAGEGGKVNEFKVKLKDVQWAGDSIDEWGYWGHSTKEKVRLMKEYNAQKQATPPAATPLAVPSNLSYVTTPQGRVETRFKLIELDDLIASHNDDLSKNPNFPKEKQPRARDRIAYEQQINDIANNPDPYQLLDNSMPEYGAPIVDAENFVESGNGRVIGMRKAFRLGNDVEYKDVLRNEVSKYGISPGELDNFEKPFLVRQRITDVDEKAFTRSSNKSNIASMSAAERAVMDAEALDDNLLDLINVNEDGDLLSASNRDFLNAFVTRTGQDLAEFQTKDGTLSQEGLKKIKNALIEKAYSNDGLTELLTESTDDNIKNISKALMKVAPEWAKLRSQINKGALHDLDITESINQAVSVVRGAKATGYSLDQALKEILDQQELLSEFGIDETAKGILKLFVQHKQSPGKIQEFFKKYAQAADSFGSPQQAGLFGDAETPIKEELFKTVLSGDLDEELLAKAMKEVKVPKKKKKPIIEVEVATAPSGPKTRVFKGKSEKDTTLAAWIKEQAERQAVKALDIRKGFIDRLTHKGKKPERVNEVGRTLLDLKLVRNGQNSGNILEEAEVAKDRVAKELVDLINGVTERTGDLSEQVLQKIQLNPLHVAERIEQEVIFKLKEFPVYRKIVERLQEEVDQIKLLGSMDFERAEAHKSAMQSFLYESKNPIAKDPFLENFRKIAGIWRDESEQALDRIAKEIGEPDTLAEFKKLKKYYGDLSEVVDVGKDTTNRQLANRTISPSDYFAGGATGVAMGTADAFGGFGVGAILGGIGNKLAREYGNAISAVALDKVRKLAILEKFVIRTRQDIKKSIGSFLSNTPAKAIKQGAVYSASQSYSNFFTQKDLLNEYAANPEKLVSKLAEEMDGLNEAAPLHSVEVQTTLSNAVAFLQSKLPASKTEGSNLFFENEEKPNSIELARFNRYVRYINQPLTVVEELSRGVATIEGAEVLEAVYPALYEEIQMQITEELIDLRSKKKSISYNQKLMLWQLFKIPTDATMQPKFIQSMQTPKEEQQQAASSKSPQIAESFQTTMQAIG